MCRKASSLVLLLLCAFVSGAGSARAQDPPPRIPWFAVDLHASVPRFPSDDQELADSRGMTLAELPGRGWGVQAGAHFYPLRWRVITFGVGGEIALGRSSTSPPSDAAATVRPARCT